jgi:two-component system CheB/CheR fusion protein
MSESDELKARHEGQDRPSYDRIELPQDDDEIKELLKRAVEASNNSVVISDPTQPDNPLVYVNQGFKQLTGYTEEEILGRNCRFLQVDPDGNRHDEQPGVQELARAVSEGEFCRAVIRNFKKDGTMFWNELYLTPVHDEEGNLINYIGVQNDVTERVELNEELEARVRERTQELEEAKERAERASRAKSAFLANMSHEIRTPLTAILGLTDVIRAKSRDGQFEEHTRRIKAAGSRLMETLSSLLTLAKLEAGAMDVDLDPVTISDEALEVVEFFRERAEEKGLDMDFGVSDAARDARARVDSGALNSALQNLISNAIKFTDEGRVKVVVYVNEDDRLAIDVRDTGIGISDEFEPYLFDDFRQESDGLTREYDGTGLGLSITKQLVEAMNGSISVRSEVGEGSVFTVTFPQARAPQEEREHVAEQVTTPQRNGSKVLLVEDNENTVFLVESILEDVVDLDAAHSAQEAYEQAQHQAYDLLLLDINLGAGGSGVDLLRRLRELDTYAEVPMAALTAIAMPGDKEELLAQGFDDYLAKPFEADDLAELLDRHL